VRTAGLLSRFTLGWRLVAALVLGVAAGPRSAVLRPLGGLLLALLESLAVPAVVAFVLAGVSGVALRRMGALGARLVAAFALLSLAATAVGAACAVLTLGTTVAPRVPQPGPPAPLPRWRRDPRWTGSAGSRPRPRSHSRSAMPSARRAPRPSSPFVGKANTPVNALGRLACVAALVPRNGGDESRALDGRPCRLASSG
jgi:hypothetical protein